MKSLKMIYNVVVGICILSSMVFTIQILDDFNTAVNMVKEKASMTSSSSPRKTFDTRLKRSEKELKQAKNEFEQVEKELKHAEKWNKENDSNSLIQDFKHKERPDLEEKAREDARKELDELKN